MPKLNIKLGTPMSELTPTPMPEMGEDKKHYPMLHIASDESLDLPKEGTMTIRYKKVAREEREDSDGDMHYHCDIQVHEIVDAYAEENPDAKPGNKNSDTEEALDGLMKEKRANKKKSTY